MERLGIRNAFGPPVLYEETVSSTMDAAREMASRGFAHGSVIAAGFQEKGRGRQERPWRMERGKAIAFTLCLDYGAAPLIPPALTLRVGLAVASGIEDFLPPLAGRVVIKWPNDILLNSPAPGAPARKAAGILTEAEGGKVFIGIGVNVAQETFPPELADKAVSLYAACSAGAACGPGKAAALCSPPPHASARFTLVEKILARLREELETEAPWRERLAARLYLRGKRVVFVEGAADSGREIRGVLSGVGAAGELLLIPDGEAAPRAFVTGELRYGG
ncbi:MAG: biotin-(acetyl-CoA-carboxylase) ligase [Treponematales bacterium]